MAKKKVANKANDTRVPKAIPTTHKMGRYDDVPFVFYDDELTIHQKGIVVVREDAMVLEIPEQDGYPPALVIGKSQRALLPRNEYRQGPVVYPRGCKLG